MTALQQRFKAVIERLGDTYSVGGTSGKTLCAVLSKEDAHAYLTSAEIAAAAVPIYAFYVPYDDATATGSTVTWNSLSFAVKRVISLQFEDSTVVRLLICV